MRGDLIFRADFDHFTFYSNFLNQKMHILSSHRRSEFLATPQLVRFEYARGEKGPETTLLIKSSTLILKYILLGIKIQLLFMRQKNRVIYAIKICDDRQKPGFLWSILETDEEISAITALASGEPCQIFLFNELALNVAWTVSSITSNPNLTAIVKAATTGHVDHSDFDISISHLLEKNP